MKEFQIKYQNNPPIKFKDLLAKNMAEVLCNLYISLFFFFLFSSLNQLPDVYVRFTFFSIKIILIKLAIPTNFVACKCINE